MSEENLGEQVHALLERGMSISAIARHLNRSWNTIVYWACGKREYPKRQTRWTPQMMEALIEMWGRKGDNAVSAAYISEKLGVSKNAVIGQAHRMRLEKKAIGSPRQSVKHRTVRKRQKAVAGKPFIFARTLMRLSPKPTEEVKVVTGGMGLMELTDNPAAPRFCRAVIGKGDDGFARYCGTTTAWRWKLGEWTKAPYCDDHCERYYNS